MGTTNVTSIAFTEFAPQVKAYASKTAEQLKQLLSEEGNRTQADQFVKDIKTLNTNCEGIKTEAKTETEKKNIFRRGWDGIKKGYNKIISFIKWPYTQLKSLFSKSTEKEAKTGEAATQTEAQTQTQNTTTTSNTEGGATTETKPPATNTSNQDSTQTQNAA